MQERHDLLPGSRRKIVQRADLFSYSMDAVLLGKFATMTKKTNRIIDLCSGTGAVPLVMSERTRAAIDAIEIQEALVTMSRKTMAINGLSDQVTIHHGDVSEAGAVVPWNRFDLVTCNPPYFKVTADTDLDGDDPFVVARHEVHLRLEAMIGTSKKLLKSKGRLAMVHRPERTGDIFAALEAQRFQAKRMQFVHPDRSREANMVLIEAVRDGQPGLTVLPPLIVYDETKDFTKEFRDHYVST